VLQVKHSVTLNNRLIDLTQINIALLLYFENVYIHFLRPRFTNQILFDLCTIVLLVRKYSSTHEISMYDFIQNAIYKLYDMFNKIPIRYRVIHEPIYQNILGIPATICASILHSFVPLNILKNPFAPQS